MSWQKAKSKAILNQLDFNEIQFERAFSKALHL